MDTKYYEVLLDGLIGKDIDLTLFLADAELTDVLGDKAADMLDEMGANRCTNCGRWHLCTNELCFPCLKLSWLTKYDRLSVRHNAPSSSGGISIR